MKTLWAGSSAGVPVVLAKNCIYVQLSRSFKSWYIKKKEKKKRLLDKVYLCALPFHILPHSILGHLDTLLCYETVPMMISLRRAVGERTCRRFLWKYKGQRSFLTMALAHYYDIYNYPPSILYNLHSVSIGKEFSAIKSLFLWKTHFYKEKYLPIDTDN